MARRLHELAAMDDDFTFEQLVTDIYESYQHAFGDAELAAVATEATLNELFFEAALDEARCRQAG